MMQLALSQLQTWGDATGVCKHFFSAIPVGKYNLVYTAKAFAEYEEVWFF